MSIPLQDQDYQSPIVRFGMWFFGGLLILASPIAGCSMVQSMLEGQASADWPTTKGKVTQARVAEQKTMVTRGGVSQQEISYRPSVQYRYEVAGKGYLGERISLAGQYTKVKEEADAVLSRYPIDADVKVYYDPASPRSSFLEPGVTDSEYYKLAIPLGMLLLGIAICWGARHLKKQAEQRKRNNPMQDKLGSA